MLLLIASFLAGFVRGLSGFGAAMVFMPIALNVISIREALVLLFMIGLLPQIPFLFNAYKNCKFKDLFPVIIGASFSVPLGVTVALHLDRVLIQNLVSGMILALVFILTLGWRYKSELKIPQAVGVGSFAGLAGGLAGLYGPILSLLWLGSEAKTSATIRANLIIFFAVISVVEAITFFYKGMLGIEIITRGLYLVPLYFVGMFIGAVAFKYSSERIYRNVTLSLCGFAAISNLFL